MSLYNGPPRPGARGGRDQFSWDNVKADKDREYYLGHSVKALAGRWQKGKDVYWYTREKQAKDTLADEVQAVKQREEELMLEALGLKPKTVVKPAPQLDKHDLDELIKGNQDEDEAQEGRGAAAQEADRVKGLGFVAGTGGGAPTEAVYVTLPGSGGAPPVPGGGPQRDGGAGASSRLPPPPPLPGRPGAALAVAVGMSAAQLKELRRAEKRAKKEAKKEAKRAKQAAKKAKKAKRDNPDGSDKAIEGRKRHRRARSSSPSSASGSSDSETTDSGGAERRRQRPSSPAREQQHRGPPAPAMADVRRREGRGRSSPPPPSAAERGLPYDRRGRDGYAGGVEDLRRDGWRGGPAEGATPRRTRHDSSSRSRSRSPPRARLAPAGAASGRGPARGREGEGAGGGVYGNGGQKDGHLVPRGRGEWGGDRGEPVGEERREGGGRRRHDSRSRSPLRGRQRSSRSQSRSRSPEDLRRGGGGGGCGAGSPRRQGGGGYGGVRADEDRGRQTGRRRHDSRSPERGRVPGR